MRITLEDTVHSRFFTDEHGSVFDSYALYLVTTLNARKPITGDWVGFYFNRIAKDYLYKLFGDQERDYKPLPVEFLLLSETDEEAFDLVIRKWMSQFEKIYLRVETRGKAKYSAVAYVRNSEGHREQNYRGHHKTFAEAALFALSGLCFQISSVILTERLRSSTSGGQ